MLFIVAMDPLQKFLHLASKRGLLHPIASRLVGVKTSLYNDAAAIFVHPSKQDTASLRETLMPLWEAT
jgi:hypothetical protein